MTFQAMGCLIGVIATLLSACQTVIPVADGLGLSEKTDTDSASAEADTDTDSASAEADTGTDSASADVDTDTDSASADVDTDTDSASAADTNDSSITDEGSESVVEITTDITSASLAHHWRFNGDLDDDVGESDAVIVEPNNTVSGNAILNDNEVYLEGGAPLNAEWISLGTGLLNEHGGGAVSIELFATQWHVNRFSRIFEFGASNYEYLLMTWSYESNADGDLVRWWDESQVSKLDTNAPYVLGQEYHIVMIVEPGGGTDGAIRMTWYTAPTDAEEIGEAAGSLETSDPIDRLRDIDCWLGKSHVVEDPVANASYNDVRIWSGALTESDILRLHQRGPNI